MKLVDKFIQDIRSLDRNTIRQIPFILGVSVLGAALVFSPGVHTPSSRTKELDSRVEKYEEDHKKFIDAYNNKTIEFADTDNDNNYSREEIIDFRDKFYTSILFDHGAEIGRNGQEIYKNNGKLVSYAKLAEWLDSYRPSEKKQ